MAGEVASGIAVRTLIESFAATAGIAPATAAEERLSSAICQANDQVRQAALEHTALRSMGTTLVCACLDGGRMVIGNVGDSRAYLIRDGICLQITKDHSYVEEQLRAGNMKPEMASLPQFQSIITRAIGAADSVQPDIYAAPIRSGDLILLTTDGLTRYASAEEIARLVGDQHDVQNICLALIEYAKGLGGADNVTCLLLRVVERPADGSVLEA